MNILDITNGHIKELFNINKELSDSRMKICRICPLFLNKLGGICNNRLWLNVNTGDVSVTKKEGYKFIITEVFETPKEKIDKRSNGNRSKYVEPFMNYVMSTFDEKYLDEYFTISNWTVGVLKLLDKEICNSIYKDDDELLKYIDLVVDAVILSPSTITQVPVVLSYVCMPVCI